MNSRNSRKHIVISGYYGFSNVGDEAILLSLHQALRSTIKDVELVVLSAHPEETEREHNLRAIPRLNLLRLWRELRSADLLISGGGSLFQDSTSTRSLYVYLVILVLGLLARCPVMIYAQGIGPLSKSYNRRLTAFVLRHVNLITVRDQQSLQELRNLGVTRPPVYLTADPVLALQTEPSAVGLGILREMGLLTDENAEAALPGPLIGISIRPWKNVDHLLTELGVVIRRLIEQRGARVVLIPMHYPGDDQITEELRQRLAMPHAVQVLPKGCNVEQMISLMACLNLMIGVRLHALVFAAIAATPAIAISYDPKVDHFAQRMQQHSAGSLAEVQAETLWQAACELLDHESEVRARTVNLSAELRREALRSAELAAELLRLTIDD